MQPFAAMPLAQQQPCAAIAARERGHDGDPFLPRALTLSAAHDIDPLPLFAGQRTKASRQGVGPGLWRQLRIAIRL
jgi:hypothetical protein